MNYYRLEIQTSVYMNIRHNMIITILNTCAINKIIFQIITVLNLNLSLLILYEKMSMIKAKHIT